MINCRAFLLICVIIVKGSMTHLPNIEGVLKQNTVNSAQVESVGTEEIVLT